MLTLSPLPDFALLFKSLFSSNFSNEKIANRWHKDGENALLFSRSSWSIAYVAFLRMKMSPNKIINIWIPDYFCNETLLQLRHVGVNIFFYQINDKMLPNISSFTELFKKGKPDIFLFVHYFGKPIPANNIKEFCKKNDTWLIEDAAHVLFPIKGIGVFGDFVLYSQHKHLPIPDGAILVLRKNGPSQFIDDETSSFSKKEILIDFIVHLKKNNLKIQNKLLFKLNNVKWLLKRLIQKTGLFNNLNKKINGFNQNPIFSFCEVIPPGISKMSSKMLSHLSLELDKIACVRRENQIIFDYIIHKDTFYSQKINYPERPNFSSWYPYLSEYIIDNGMSDFTYKNLIKDGFPVSTWPDLPPEVILDKDKHFIAWNLRQSRIYISVHQSLKLNKLIKKFFLQIENLTNYQNSITISDKISKNQWNEFMKIANSSNLLQSWDYGEAKRELEGWKIKRSVYYINQKPVALLQLLQKNILGFIKISRINRGPILLNFITESEKYYLINSISKLGNIFKCKLLFIAPNLLFSGQNFFYLYHNNFIKYSKTIWQSSLIVLTNKTDDIRKSLDGKWRNLLTLSEKNELQVEYGDQQHLFDWVLDKYSESMIEKGFQGPSVEFLSILNKQIKQNSNNSNSLLVFRAIKNGHPVGGICIILHGSVATYLLGFSTIEGRALNSTYFLLWQSINHLKDNNLIFFDLGGIDLVNTPGVAHFKLGLNGNYYENIGEFVKW
jgi:lipid II:glycine glycyltransferase (peptidoglycan interpeptide bridge formation enzyme)